MSTESADLAFPAGPFDSSPVAAYVIPDFDGALDAALSMFEELLLTLRVWHHDAQEPDGDGWRPPAQCDPATFLPVHSRLWAALRPTQTRTERRGTPGATEQVDVEPAGPQWRTASGYQLAALSFVDLQTEDVDGLGVLAAALAAPGLDAGVRDAIEDVDEREIDLTGITATGMRESERHKRGVVSSVARLHALLTITPDAADIELLRAARAAADGRGVQLDAAAEAAWHRVVNLCHRAFLAHDPLHRWVMGNADHL